MKRSYINTFPGKALQPVRPVVVHVDVQGKLYRARLIDADLEAVGESESEAVLSLRAILMRTFLRLEEGRTEEEEEQFSVLAALIRRKGV